MGKSDSACLSPIVLVFEKIVRSAEDKEQLEALKTVPLCNWLRTLVIARHAMTTGLWAEYLTRIAQNWRPSIQTLTALLPEQRRQHAANDSPENRVLDCAAEVYSALALADFSEAHEFATSGSLLTLLHQLARAVEALGYGLLAARIAQEGLRRGLGRGSEIEKLARYGIELGVREFLPDLAASFAVLLARLIVDSLDSFPERRLEAFDACEAAIERITWCPEESVTELGTELIDVVLPRQEFASLRARLLAFVPVKQSAPPDAAAAARMVWPKRVSFDSQKEWDSEELGLALHRELQADEARFKLESLPASDRPQTEWLTWRVAHPTYRSVVPFADSFRKEAKFDDLLLDLSHEITHVYSLLGGLGLTLQCLRCAEFFHVAAQLPNGMARVTTMVELFDQVCAHCAVPGPLDQRQLFHIEAGIEIAAKAQALQDTWTPWLEGLAVFGETAADPTMDEDRFGLVGEAMRGLMAFFTDPEETGDRIASGLEEAWAHAMRARGPTRLWRSFDDPHIPYFAGYMTVRTVLSAWRASLGRPLTGTQAFHLLLHATRSGTFDAIPDLSLRSDAFRNQAQARMVAWVSRLARLPKEDIEMFITPPGRSSPLYAWEDNRLTPVAADDVAEYVELENVHITARLCEAMGSLTRPGDEQRIEGAGDDTLAAVEACRNAARNYLESDNSRVAVEISQPLVDRFVNSGSVLPIGQTDAKFYLKLEAGAEFAQLEVGLRTYQPDEKENTCLGHWLGLEILPEEAHLIADHYRQTGNPRVTVTRIIDLHGLSAPAGTSVPLHFLEFRYGDWTRTLSAWDPRVGLDRERHKEFLRTTEHRFQRDPYEKLYHGPAFVGHAAVVRAYDQVRSPGWPGSLRLWQKSVQALSERFLKESREHEQRRRAASGLLRAVFKDSGMFDDPLNIDFETLTERCPAERERIVQALFESARQPGVDPLASEAAATFAKHYPYLFSAGISECDVRPAESKPGGDNGNGDFGQ